MFDFDTVIERKGTDSLKYDFARERGKAENVLPLWVADMDFRTAPAILEKLEERIHHGIFGYSEGKEEYFNALAGWYKNTLTGRLRKAGWSKLPELYLLLQQPFVPLQKRETAC